MKNNKVCHLTSVHPPFDSRIFHKECKTLAAAGYDVAIMWAHSGDETAEGVKIRAVPKYKTRRARFLRTVWDVYRQAVREDADIYHFHDYELIPAALLLKMKGKKVIYDSHEDFPRQNLTREWLAPSLRCPVSFLAEIFENLSVRAFDAVIGATPHIAERFRGLGCDTVVINNYPFLHAQPTPAMEQQQQLRAVCYAGAVSRQKGIVEIVAAIGQTDVMLTVAGKIEGKGLFEQLQSMPGWKQVNYLGYIPKKEVDALLPKCLAGLSTFHPAPNYLESQPIKMYEYMAAGIPIIVSDFPYWRNIIEKHRCGLCVDPLNAKEIAEAIQWLADHPAEAREMGANGRLAVERDYNWQTEEKKLLALYERLLGG
jgi:glycosyltransferase involved in cell wall biosynthesis